jgi:peroxiredoxin Q/BCP
MLNEGDAAPDVPVKDDSGKTVRLSDYRGKTVVLYFYPRDDTPGCTTEACGLRDANAEILAKKAIVLGVSADTPESHRKFKDKFGLPFALLSDPGKELIRAFGAIGMKNMYGKKFEGILRSTFIIDPKGRISKVFPKVSPATHAAQVLEALG